MSVSCPPPPRVSNVNVHVPSDSHNVLSLVRLWMSVLFLIVASLLCRSLPPGTWPTCEPTSESGSATPEDARGRWRQCRFWRRQERRRARKREVINTLKSWSNSSHLEECGVGWSMYHWWGVQQTLDSCIPTFYTPAQFRNKCVATNYMHLHLYAFASIFTLYICIHVYVVWI